MSRTQPTPRRWRRSGALVAALGLIVLSAGCSTSTTPAVSTGATTQAASGAPLNIVATTGYLGDLAKNVAPDATVTVLVKPGGDPHEYQASTQDLNALQSADLVLSNGLGLESSLAKQLQALGGKHVAVAEKLPKNQLLPWKAEKDEHGHEGHDGHPKEAKPQDDHGHGEYDPHVWNSPTLWSAASTVVANSLGTMRSAQATAYTNNAKAYTAKIAAVQAEGKAKLAALPKDRRIVVTGHDAFNYLGAAFGLTIRASDVISPEANLSPSDVNALASLIASKKIPTIFPDNVKNPQAVTSIQQAVKSKGFAVALSPTPLYSDSLGDAAPVDTYLGVLKHNLDTIAKGLGGK